MKKILLMGFMTVSLFSAFLPNKVYNCENIGLTFKDKNITRNIPNNDKTKKDLQKILKDLYTIQIKLDKNKTLDVTAGKKSDKLLYIKKFKSLDVYVTGDKKVLMFLDSNHTQVGMMIPSQSTMIYYQCKSTTLP